MQTGESCITVVISSLPSVDWAPASPLTSFPCPPVCILPWGWECLQHSRGLFIRVTSGSVLCFWFYEAYSRRIGVNHHGNLCWTANLLFNFLVCSLETSLTCPLAHREICANLQLYFDTGSLGEVPEPFACTLTFSHTAPRENIWSSVLVWKQH